MIQKVIWSDEQAQSSAAPGRADGGQPSVFVNLLFTIAIPSLILMKLSANDTLGPLVALLVALAFPIGYGLYGLVKEGKPGFFAVFGLINVLLTGGLGLMEVDGFWFAVKEASVPLIFGLGVLVSLKTESPLVRSLLLNEKFINLPLVHERIAQASRERDFERLLTLASVFLAGSFLLSAILNFSLARVILQSPSGTPAFNEELGRMTALSFPVIALPCTLVTAATLWWLFVGLKRITGLGMDELLHDNAGQRDKGAQCAPKGSAE